MSKPGPVRRLTCRGRRILIPLCPSLALITPVSGAVKKLVINTGSPPKLALFMELVTREALSHLGYALEVNVRPGGRSLYDADGGIADGEGLRVGGLTAQYPHLVQVPESSYDVEMSAFTRRPDVRITCWGDLSRWRVGFPLGWKIYEQNVRGPDVVRVKDHDALFRMLALGRLDVVLLQKMDGLALLRKLGIGDARILEPPLAVMPHYLYLNEKHRELVPRLAAEIAAMKRDGRTAAIYARVMK